MIENQNNLSPDGQRRREEILDHAIREATDRRYARIERRLGATLIVAMALTGTLLTRHSPPAALTQLPIAHRSPPENKPSPAAPPDGVQIVQTDPHIVERLSLSPAPPSWTVIGDDELLATLSESGHPAGLIEINGQTRIIFR